MSLLLAGILLWTIIHFIPVFAPAMRGNIINKLGIGPYKGLFALSLVGAIALMVIGWQNYPELYYYPPLVIDRWVIFGLIFFAFILFTASIIPSNFNRVWRNPQLSSVIVWAAAHLVTSGAARSVILFGGLLIWAALMIIGSNRRDGEWVKPIKRKTTQDLKVVVVAAVAYSIILFSHQYFTDIPLI